MHILCEDLTKRYPQGEGAITAVDIPRLTLAPGETAVLLGVSGSGKTTLLRLLGLLEPPTAGRIVMDGRAVGGLAETRRAALRATEIGFVHQNFALIPMLSVEENILLPRYIAGRPAGRPDDRDELRRLAALLGIADKLQNLPSTLSAGQQQRVAIARALINRPKLLLCDEPTANLDRRTRDEVAALLGDVRAAYAPTTVIVTHDPALAPLGEAVYTMADGRISRER